MSLYHDASTIILNPSNTSDSLKLRIFSRKSSLKSQPAQLYALLIETQRWNFILKQIIERSDLLAHERKLTPALSLVLVHDLLLAKRGIAAPSSHPLRAAVERHRARLHAELIKVRVQRGFATLGALRASLAELKPHGDGNEGSEAPLSRPRWVRVNALKTTLGEQLRTTFASFTRVQTLSDVLNSTDSVVYVDDHVPGLLAVPASTNVTMWKAYRDGELILQDKASCFPALLLEPEQFDCVIDACAAPGNKTTHLAALMAHTKTGPRIYACEQDKTRAVLLQHMVEVASADKIVHVRAGQDFLKVDANAALGRDEHGEVHAQAILLDPSCSGSGMVGRDDKVEWAMPESTSSLSSKKTNARRKPRELDRGGKTDEEPREEPALIPANDSALKTRLQALAAFQLRLIEHAFTFRHVRRITYSTCSIYEEENEQVVLAGLASAAAKQHGWTILPRAQQIDAMCRWHMRGRLEGVTPEADVIKVLDACIRCAKATGDGTQGFFVATFTREHGLKREIEGDVTSADGLLNSGGGEEEDWEGFSD